MRTNKSVSSEKVYTHEGGAAVKQSPRLELERAVATCLLFEDTFYEGGESIAGRISALCTHVSGVDIHNLAVRARHEWKLRHVPLWLCVQLLKHRDRALASRAIYEVVNRPDELSELLALYWHGGRKPLSAQLKKGLALAFTKFGPPQLAKWNRDSEIKLRDVLFLCHAKPLDQTQAETWKRLINGTLDPPDTWEVALSAGRDKKATWERLLCEGKLGDMALLMNLRNMEEAGVDKGLVTKRLRNWSPSSVVLPFRFITAAKAAPDYEDALGMAIQSAMSTAPRLHGRTLYVIDVSGSMRGRLSMKSEMTRVDAACGLAMFLREVSEEVVIYATAGNDYTRIHATQKVPPRRTFALRDSIRRSNEWLGSGGIFAHQALTYIQSQEKREFDRVIILSDEQDCDLDRNKTLATAPCLAPHQYLLNVAPYKPGLDTSHGWIRINGWSERAIDWIRLHEEEGCTERQNDKDAQ